MVITGGVGARVAEERKLAGLTQYQLATRATVSVSLIRTFAYSPGRTSVDRARLRASPPGAGSSDETPSVAEGHDALA
ncbi:MAG: helix-turn-helix domain-containing protein [Pseudonocardiaceae bacterium]